VFLRISSKDLIDEGVLGWQGKKVVLLEKMEMFFAIGGVGKDFKTSVKDGGWGHTGDNILGTVRDVKERVIFNVLEDRPGKLRGWGTWNNRSGCWGSVSVKIRTWEIPSIVVRLEDFENGGSGIGDILLIYIIKG